MQFSENNIFFDGFLTQVQKPIYLVIMALRVTPVPIPNTKVKPYRADGTAGAALWESRLLPDQKNTKLLA